MAASSSDESSIAQKDFHLSSYSDSGSRLSPCRQKCPLCRSFRKTFYCKDCVRSGSLYHSKQTNANRYISISDRQKFLLELEDNKRTIERDCLKLLESKQKSDVLHWKIRQSKEKNEILKLAVKEKKDRKVYNIKKLSELKEKNEKHQKSLPKYEHKVHEMENYVAGKKDKVDRSKETAASKQEDLQKIVKLRVQQLFKYIFPICKVKPTMEVGSSSDDMVSALAEASQTTYIRDRWEYTDYSGEMQYSIVAPALPGSGNYSAYNIWVAQNHDAVPGSNATLLVEQNPAFSIGAALTYTAQLLHVLSFYLNVRLPFKMLYSDFCSSDMNEQQFSRRVARLNANVLYLCLSQDVDPCSLRTNETIHNVLRLAESSELGRQGPVDLDAHQASVLEQPLTDDLKVSDDSDSEECLSFREWEAVPHVQCPEASAGASSHSPQMISTQQASSMAGGLVNSAAAGIASIWRGFTGR